MQEEQKIEPLALSPDLAARRMGVSTRSIYNLIASGDLKSFKVGKRRLITDATLVEFVRQKVASAG